MKIKKYNRYKDSGVEWLGEIPEHWEINRLKNIGDVRYGLGQPPREKINGLPIIRATNVSRGKVTPSKMLFVDPEDIPYERKPILKTGDIIVVRSGAYTGDSAIIPKEYDGAVTGYDMVFSPKKVFPKFIAYSILSDYIYRDQLILTSLRAAQPHLNKEELNSTLAIIPPQKEQTQIANYLDAKTTVIDKKIRLLKQKIKHYKAYQKTLINKTVTKGLENNISHWVSFRLKDIGYLYSGLSGKNSNDFNQDDNLKNKGFIPFTNIANNTYLNQNHLDTVVIEENESQNQVKQNDIFFLMSSEGYDDIGKSAVLKEDIKETYLNSFCKGFRITNKNCEASFVNYLLLSNSYRQKMLVEGKGFTRINLKMEKVNNFSVLIPPTKKEQQQIASYLDTKTTTIDNIVHNIETQIATLKELRKTLINDVVTGKVKVSA